MVPAATSSGGPEGLGSRFKVALTAWAIRHMDFLFRITRNTLPILRVGYGGKTYVLVTRFEDVQEVLQRPNVFDVIYAPKIAVLMDGDNIFLGMRDEEPATRDKASMRLTAPRGEAATRIKPMVERLAEEAVTRAGGRIDVVSGLAQSVTTQFFAEYIGIAAPEGAGLEAAARLSFQFMFADLGNARELLERVRPVAAGMRTLVENGISQRKSRRGQHDDMLERCLKLQDEGFPGMSDREIRNNLIGMIVGGLPQPPMVVPQLLDVLLNRPQNLAAAQAAARAGDDDQLSRHVFEALRFYPLTPGLFRRCVQPYRLAGGTWRGTVIPEGALVFAATRSAMFDGRRVPSATQFRVDRADYNYMHFGYGMHECFAVYINRMLLPAICKALLRRANLRRAKGVDGTLRMDGIFATSLVVEYDI